MSFWSNLFGGQKAAIKAATANQSPQSSLTESQARLAANSLQVMTAYQLKDVEVTNVANTNSMLPMVDSNSLLLLERCAFEDLEIGDVVTFYSRGLRILHRIFERRGDQFWTRGINNNRPDDEYVTRLNFDKRLVAIVYHKHTETSRT